MERQPIVALGAKDRSSPSLGQRMASHFHKNRAVYSAVGAAAVGAAGAAGAAFIGHELGRGKGYQSGLERGHENGRKDFAREQMQWKKGK